MWCCAGRKIYPGRGKVYVRGDSKIFRFFNGKSESLFLQRKNPRRIAWTVLFRRQHKKGVSEVRPLYTLRTTTFATGKKRDWEEETWMGNGR